MIDEKTAVPPATPRGDRSNGTGPHVLRSGTRPRLSNQMAAVLVILTLVVGLGGGRILFGGGDSKTVEATPTTTSSTTTPSPSPTTVPPTSAGSAGTGSAGSSPATDPTTVAPTTSTKRPITPELMTVGRNFSYATDWYVQGKKIESAGQWSNYDDGSDTGELGLIVPEGVTKLTGKLVLGDRTETADVSVDVKVLADGQSVQTGKVTMAQPLLIDQNVTGHRRLSVQTTIARGTVSADSGSDVAVVFVDGSIE